VRMLRSRTVKTMQMGWALQLKPSLEQSATRVLYNVCYSHRSRDVSTTIQEYGHWL